MIYLTMLVCFICSILITPVVKKLAFKIGATDKPNKRKVHQKIMPRLGGLAIYISFVDWCSYYTTTASNPNTLVLL